MGHVLVLNADWLPMSTLPLSTFHWHDAMKAIYLDTVRVVEEYDNWTIHSPHASHTVPAVVVARAHVKVRKNVTFSDEMIYLRDNYTCQYCQHAFPRRKLTLDHVIPKSHGGKLNFLNLVAACSPCNNKRGTNTRIRPKVEPYRPNYYELAEKAKKYPITVPHPSWLKYIGWPDHLVEIAEPVDMPGYTPANFMKPLLQMSA